MIRRFVSREKGRELRARPFTMPFSQPENPRAMRLADLGLCWLQLSGCCGRSTSYPLPLMAQRLGEQRLLGDVLPRLLCTGCGGKPARMVLLDRADDSLYGARARKSTY
jgi:hypothetical protein